MHWRTAVAGWGLLTLAACNRPDVEGTACNSTADCRHNQVCDPAVGQCVDDRQPAASSSSSRAVSPSSGASSGVVLRGNLTGGAEVMGKDGFRLTGQVVGAPAGTVQQKDGYRLWLERDGRR